MAQISSGGAFRFRDREFYGPLRGFRGKPFHPPLTDIPVGAYVIAPILDLIAFLGRNATWSHQMFMAAGYVFLVGASFSLLTAATGVADWSRTPRGSDVRRKAGTHGLVMVTMTVLVLTDLSVRFLGHLRTTSALVLALSAAIFVLVAAGSAIGGSLVYDHGMRVAKDSSQPAASPR